MNATSSSHTHTYTHTLPHHTHLYTQHTDNFTLTHTYVGPGLLQSDQQMLVKAGGKDLLMLTNKNGLSCLQIAAHKGHEEMGKVRQDVCKHMHDVCKEMRHTKR